MSDPNNMEDDLAQCLHNRALCHHSLGNYDLAISDLNWSLKINPTNRKSLTLRAKCLQKTTRKTKTTADNCHKTASDLLIEFLCYDQTNQKEDYDDDEPTRIELLATAYDLYYQSLEESFPADYTNRGKDENFSQYSLYNHFAFFQSEPALDGRFLGRFAFKCAHFISAVERLNRYVTISEFADFRPAICLNDFQLVVDRSPVPILILAALSVVASLQILQLDFTNAHRTLDRLIEDSYQLKLKESKLLRQIALAKKAKTLACGQLRPLAAEKLLNELTYLGSNEEPVELLLCRLIYQLENLDGTLRHGNSTDNYLLILRQTIVDELKRKKPIYVPSLIYLNRRLIDWPEILTYKVPDDLRWGLREGAVDVELVGANLEKFSLIHAVHCGIGNCPGPLSVEVMKVVTSALVSFTDVVRQNVSGAPLLTVLALTLVLKENFLLDLVDETDRRFLIFRDMVQMVFKRDPSLPAGSIIKCCLELATNSSHLQRSISAAQCCLTVFSVSRCWREARASLAAFELLKQLQVAVDFLERRSIPFGNISEENKCLSKVMAAVLSLATANCFESSL